MTVSPLPRDGVTLADRDRPGRTLRIAHHPETGRVVLSVWQDGSCRATVRLARPDVMAVVAELSRLLPPTPAPDEPPASRP